MSKNGRYFEDLFRACVLSSLDLPLSGTQNFSPAKARARNFLCFRWQSERETKSSTLQFGNIFSARKIRLLLVSQVVKKKEFHENFGARCSSRQCLPTMWWINRVSCLINWKKEETVQVQRKRKLAFFNNLEFFVSCVFIYSEQQSQIICRNCTDRSEKPTKTFWAELLKAWLALTIG